MGRRYDLVAARFKWQSAQLKVKNMKYIRCLTLSLSLLISPTTLRADDAAVYSYTGRISAEVVEIADIRTGQTQVLTRDEIKQFEGFRPNPLSAETIATAIVDQAATLECAGYEPFFDLTLSRDEIGFEIGDIHAASEAPPVIIPVTGLSSYLTFQTRDKIIFGMIEIGSSNWEEQAFCEFGLEDDDGFQSFISAIHGTDTQSLASCCHLVWNSGG